MCCGAMAFGDAVGVRLAELRLALFSALHPALHPALHHTLHAVLPPPPQLHFTPDARESEVTVYHKLKLFEDDGTINQKKPVVSETYEDVIFSEPHEDFYMRVSRHVPGACTLGKGGEGLEGLDGICMERAARVRKHQLCKGGKASIRSMVGMALVANTVATFLSARRLIVCTRWGGRGRGREVRCEWERRGRSGRAWHV